MSEDKVTEKTNSGNSNIQARGDPDDSNGSLPDSGKSPIEPIPGKSPGKPAAAHQVNKNRNKTKVHNRGKNIVIFSDGTGQDGGVGYNTNVYSLFNMILDRSDGQISFYDPGLGTEKGNKLGLLFGRGISRNIEQSYQFLSDNFSASDKIYLFGFSRGASTVRTLSGFIHMFGILPRSRPELFKRAYKIYKIRDPEQRRKRAEEFIELNHTMWTKIRFIGVWDTVAALGLPRINKLIDWIPFLSNTFHDFALSESVEYGRHALAIDEKRKIFEPVLWDEQGPRKSGSLPGGPEFFSETDITNIYRVAEKLTAANFVSDKIRTMFSSTSQSLLRKFSENRGRRASKREEDDLIAIVVERFNKIIENAEAIFPTTDKDKDGLDTSDLSAATSECIDNLKESPPQREVKQLNRLLLEDIYSLKPRIKQVWFAGAHSDVGGGYAENALAQIPLLWMMNEAMDLGLRIYPNHKVDLKPDSASVLHDSSSGFPTRVRQWKTEEHNGRRPLVHESVIERSREVPFYKPWILKTDYDKEPLPERLEASIQYDEEKIWRKPVWGWGTAFEERWEDIERVSCDESHLKPAIIIHMKKGLDINVEGSLPAALSAFVEKLERKREKARLDKQEEEQNDRVEEMNEIQKALTDYMVDDTEKGKQLKDALDKIRSQLK